jgi:Sec-independent protein secretion pathway component TatC
MNKKIKVFLILILILSMCIAFSNAVFADYSSEMSSLLTDQDTWDDTTNTTSTVQNITGTVISVARIIGVTIAVVMLLVLAMKYMSAAPGEKADIKKSAVVYVVGAVILFAVVGILGIIEQFSSAIK